MQYSQTERMHMHTWTEIRPAQNQVHLFLVSNLVIKVCGMMWFTKKNTNRESINVEKYAIAAKEVKDGHLSVRKAANAFKRHRYKLEKN